MKEDTKLENKNPKNFNNLLEGILKEGARKMLQAAIENDIQTGLGKIAIEKNNERAYDKNLSDSLNLKDSQVHKKEGVCKIKS